jgi:LysM repeat protein
MDEALFGNAEVENPEALLPETASEVSDNEVQGLADAGNPEDVPVTPPMGGPRPDTYVVADGDTIIRIAARFDLLPRSVIWANNLDRPDSIRVGQRLSIPSEDLGEPPAPNPAPVASRPTARISEAAFIQKLVPGAQASQQATRVPASITLAQAIHETGWGSSFLAREANNYFGIKAHSRPGPAGVVWIDAWEVEDGENVVRQEPFRRYNDVSESLIEHGYFFHENRRYRPALEVTDDAREFARRIAAAGYATDPKYADKLISFMDRYDLYQYDTP